MQTNSRVMISTFQAVSILTVCRIFSSVTYSSQNNGTNITSSMIAFVFGFLFDLIIILPFLFLIKKRSTASVVEFSHNLNHVFGKITAGVLAVIFTFVCALNLASFTRFIAKEFLNTNIFPILFILTLAISYCALMGIEALGRFSNIVMFVTLISLAGVFLLFLGEYNLNNFYSPLEDNFKNTLIQGIIEASSSFEVLSVLVLAPVVNGRKKRGFLWFLIITLLSLEIIIFTIGAVFGDYAALTTYTFYDLIRISGFSNLRRIDSVYVAVWVLLGFVKSGYYLFLSKTMLDSFFKKPKTSHTLTISAFSAFIIATVFLLKPNISQPFNTTLKVIAILITVILPFILLKRRKRHET